MWRSILLYKGEEFALTISPAPVEYNGFEKEEVTINGNSGFYTASELFGTSIHWTEDDYQYILLSKVSKEMTIEIAESFRWSESLFGIGKS
mgnify:FL=1